MQWARGCSTVSDELRTRLIYFCIANFVFRQRWVVEQAWCEGSGKHIPRNYGHGFTQLHRILNCFFGTTVSVVDIVIFHVCDHAGNGFFMSFSFVFYSYASSVEWFIRYLSNKKNYQSTLYCFNFNIFFIDCIMSYNMGSTVLEKNKIKVLESILTLKLAVITREL